IATAALAERLALPVDGPLIVIDDNGADHPLPARVPARSLAYISHTSGSSGTPNPAMIEHAALHAYLRFIATAYGFGPHPAAVQLSPLDYDGSIRDVFAPLAAGGRVILLPRTTLLDPTAFAGAVEEFGGTTVLSATPTFLTALAEREGVAARLRGL